MTRQTWIAAGVAMLLALSSSTLHAGNGARVAFAPATVSTTVGETVLVDVTVSDIVVEPGLASYDLVLSYDPNVVRLESFADAGFVTGGELLVICVTGEIDHLGGSVNATCTAIPLFGATGVSTGEPVPLLHASFVALGPGETELTLTGTLASPNEETIAATFESGTIAVGSDPPGATETPQPADELPATGSDLGGGASARTTMVILSGAAAALVAGCGLLLLGCRRVIS